MREIRISENGYFTGVELLFKPKVVFAMICKEVRKLSIVHM